MSRNCIPLRFILSRYLCVLNCTVQLRVLLGVYRKGDIPLCWRVPTLRFGLHGSPATLPLHWIYDLDLEWFCGVCKTSSDLWRIISIKNSCLLIRTLFLKVISKYGKYCEKEQIYHELWSTYTTPTDLEGSWTYSLNAMVNWIFGLKVLRKL